MELRVLRYFLAVAREETISGAADLLHVTQPTLSRQLMELEDEFGVKLFIRGNRKITLTDEGMLLRKRAEEILELVSKTETEIQSVDETVSGEIYIGGGETDAIGLIAEIAHTLQQEYPDIRFYMISGDKEDITERLDKGLLDFGVLLESVPDKYESIQMPVVDKWGVIMRKDSPLACLDTIRAENLADKPLIVSRRLLTSDKISGWLKKDLNTLKITATYNLLFNASVMVKKGLGYAIGLDKLINTSGTSELCFKPLEPPLESPLYIVWKRYQVFSKPAALFLERVQRDLK